MKDEVRVVHVEVEQRATRHLTVRKPSWRHGRDATERGAHDPAVPSFVDGLLQPLPLRPEPHAHRRHEQALRARRGLRNARRRHRIERERLLAEDVLAGLERGDRQRFMRGRRHADVHDVHVRMANQRLKVRRSRDARHVERVGRAGNIAPAAREITAGAFRVLIGDRHEPRTRHLAVGADVHAPHEAETDDADACHVAT